MLRLLSIEFFKLRNSKYFWVLGGLFLVFLISVPIAGKFFMDYLSEMGERISDLGLDPSEIPLFDFVDIWQNLTWFYKSFSVCLGFITVISVCNEFSYGTIRQNVIDGLSKKELLLSKLLMIIALSLLASIAALLVGILMGYLWSPVTEFTFIIKHLEFIPAYFLHLIVFQVFCLALALLIKRAGITLAGLIFYVYLIEPIAVAIIRFRFKLPWLSDLFPVSAFGNVIRLPFGKYALQETQTYVGMGDLGILLGYLLLLGFLVNWMMTRRDLA